MSLVAFSGRSGPFLFPHSGDIALYEAHASFFRLENSSVATFQFGQKPPQMHMQHRGAVLSLKFAHMVSLECQWLSATWVALAICELRIDLRGCFPKLHM